MQAETLKQQISAAKGEVDAELVLKRAKVVNVFTNEIEEADVAIHHGKIIGVGEYSGQNEVDLDGYRHTRLLHHSRRVRKGDPHEISNVAGTTGLNFMLETTRNLKLSVYFMLPSCVPSTDLDESGAVLEAKELAAYYRSERVLGLAELMNSYGTVNGDAKILQKICDCIAAGKNVDGHAPFLSGKDLNAYITAGVQSDHECSDVNEALEKLRRGQYIMVREGTAAQNMNALLPLFKEPYCDRCMLVTDDKHPGDLLRGGHIDYIIRKAIAAGVEPAVAIKMGTLIPAKYFGLKQNGAVAPGYAADLIVVSDLKNFTVESVYKNGVLAAENGKMLEPTALSINEIAFARVLNSFNMDEITLGDLELHETGENERVICLTPH